MLAQRVRTSNFNLLPETGNKKAPFGRLVRSSIDWLCFLRLKRESHAFN